MAERNVRPFKTAEQLAAERNLAACPVSLRVRIRSLLDSPSWAGLPSGAAADEIAVLIGQKFVQLEDGVRLQLRQVLYHLDHAQASRQSWQYAREALDRAIDMVTRHAPEEEAEASPPPAGSTADRLRREPDPMGVRNAEVER